MNEQFLPFERRSVAPERRSALQVVKPCRILLLKRPCGEIRLMLRQVEPLSNGVASHGGRGSAPFIYSVGFQDSLIDFCQGPGGFGRLSRNTSFTALAKSRVVDGCHVMGSKAGYKSVFATGTLPGGSQCAMRSIACMSGWIVERLMGWIRDSVEDALFVYVWEWQKRGALHLHVAVSSPHLLGLRKLERGFKQKWISTLKEAGERRGHCLFTVAGSDSLCTLPELTRANCRPSIKELGRYMAKYLSKGSKLDSSGFYCPSRWWGMSRSVRQELNRQRLIAISPILAGKDALGVLSGVSAHCATIGSAIFTHRNPFAVLDTTHIVFSPPEHQAELWKDMVDLLHALTVNEDAYPDDLKPSGVDWW